MATSAPTPPTNQFNRIRPKKPLDIWSTREKLCLASAVYKIGDQNWVSVSRAIKPYADSHRPPDWFHQKNCVSQYYDMLEQLEQQQPKRKRGDRAETDAPSLQIMRKMTIERSEQLKKEVMEMQQEFKQMKSDVESIQAGQWDDCLEEEWDKIKAEQKIKEENTTVDVMEADQKDSKESVLEQSSQGLLTSDADENTQDSVGENMDISGLAEGDASQSSMVTSTPTVSSSLDVSSKMPVASHLLSSLLQSNVKTANELQQLKIEHEQVSGATHQPQSSSSLVSSSLDKTPVKTLISQSTSQATATPSSQCQESSSSISKFACTTSTGAAVTSTSSSSTNASSSLNNTPLATVSSQALEDDDAIETKPDLEDSLVDVTTEVVEETVEDTSVILPDDAVIPKVEEGKDDSHVTCPPVEDAEEEVVGMEETVVKTEEDLDEVVVEEELKDSTTELDVEGLDSIKEEAEKDSQDEDESSFKRLPEALGSGADTDLTDTSLKLEPLSPTSSISSRISESGSKRGRRGRPKGGRSRMSSRKSYTDDERKDDNSSSKFSDADLSEEDVRDSEDLLSGALAASGTGSILSESFPNSPASLSICSDTEEEKSYKQWKKSIMLVWRAAATHKYANVFLHPVTDDIAPGYKSVVLRPMDLSTMKKNVETGAIRATVEFQRDLMLMFSNAIMYNSSDHNVYRMATEMYDDVMQHIEQYVNTQIMVQTSDAKNLRQSRRADASDKEEDTKKRRLSVDQAEGGKTKKRKTRLDETLP